MGKISNESNKYILVIDSGNGGKHTLRQLEKRLPNEKFIYLQDDKNAPYGSKTKRRLKKICKQIIMYMMTNYPIKMVVFACNTLSTVCLLFAREIFPNLPIIPTLPMIKNFKVKTLVMCTFVTKKHNDKIKHLKNNPNVEIISFRNFAKKIDENVENLDILQPFLDKKLKKYAKMNIHQVVLGCTHYNLVRKQIASALDKYSTKCRKYKPVKNKNENSQTKLFSLQSSQVNFLESSSKVAREVENALMALSLKNKENVIGETTYLKTSDYNFNSI